MAHGQHCTCGACAARRFNDNAERNLYGQTRREWHDRAIGGGGDGRPSGPTRPGGECGDCGGTGDCIHCFQGIYPRRDGTSAACGKCHGRVKRGRYPCHACRGSGYGGQKCSLPTYQETVARNRRETRKGKAAYGHGSQSSTYGRSAYGMKPGTFDGYPSLSRLRDDGTLDVFYGPDLDLDDPLKGHAIIRDGKLVNKRAPGEPR